MVNLKYFLSRFEYIAASILGSRGVTSQASYYNTSCLPLHIHSCVQCLNKEVGLPAMTLTSRLFQPRFTPKVSLLS